MIAPTGRDVKPERIAAEKDRLKIPKMKWPHMSIYDNILFLWKNYRVISFVGHAQKNCNLGGIAPNCRSTAIHAKKGTPLPMQKMGF